MVASPPLIAMGASGKGALQLMHQRIVERRNIAVFLWRQPLEPSLAGMDDQGVGARVQNLFGDVEQRRARLLIVDADAAFDRHRHAHRVLHRAHAIGDEHGAQHKAGAKGSVLHAVRRTADIEIDFVVAEGFGDPRAGGEIARLRAAKLKGQRLLEGVEAHQPRAVAVNDGAGRQHFRVKPRAPRHQPVQVAAMPIRPIHHRRHGKAPGAVPRAVIQYPIHIPSTLPIVGRSMAATRIKGKFENIAA